MNNREMAAVLFNIATVLRGQGNVNPFRTAAYERGARALMGLADEAAQVLETEEKVPFRARQHIGRKLQAKIHEMAKTGALDQYARMLSDLPPHIADLMGVPGVGPRTAERVHQTLGLETAVDLVRAARDGRLRAVRGFGSRRTGAIAALDLPEAEKTAPPQLRLFDLQRGA